MAYTFKHGDRPLEDFTIQRAVGRGGFGEVYYAVSDGGREVALKYLRENPQVELRGVAHCMNLKSPHLVTIFDVKKSVDGEYFIVMEYVAGPSLRDLLIAEPNGLGPQKAAFFLREIAKGLGYLHDRGIVHRDLKPGNIFYDEGYVKIGDYGLSKFIAVSRHSAQTASVGTVHYMAPEVGSGNYHRGIDLYALGVILYEMLLGRVPFEGSTMGEVLMKHLTAQPEIDNLPAPFGRIIRKALEKDPRDRYQNVYEMVDDLLAVENVQTSLAGFNPISLSQVVRQPVSEPLNSPAPSPNSPRGVPQARSLPRERPTPIPVGDVNDLPPRLRKRLAQRASSVEQRIRKLDAKYGKTQREDQPAPPRKSPPAYGWGRFARGKRELCGRLFLMALMAVILGFGVGMLVGGWVGGIIAGIFTVFGVAGGIGIGCRLMSYLSHSHPQPVWVERLILAMPVAALAGLGVIQLTELRFVGMRDSHVFGVWGALVVSTLLTDWAHRLRRGARGELAILSCAWTGFCTGILGLLFTDGREVAAIFAGSAAAGSSLLIQAMAWLFPLSEWLEGVRGGPHGQAPPPDGVGEPEPVGPSPRDLVGAERAVPFHEAETLAREPAIARPAGGPPPRRRGETSSDRPTVGASFLRREWPPRRRFLTRLLGMLFGLGLLGVALFLFIDIDAVMHGTTQVWNENGQIVRQLRPVEVRNQMMAERLVAVCFCLAFSFVGFHKASRLRRGGFYRDSLRPVLLACVMGAVGLMVAASWMNVPAGTFAGMRILLIACGALLLTLFIWRGRKWRDSDAPALSSASGDGSAERTGEDVAPAHS